MVAFLYCSKFVTLAKWTSLQNGCLWAMQLNREAARPLNMCMHVTVVQTNQTKALFFASRAALGGSNCHLPFLTWYLWSSKSSFLQALFMCYSEHSDSLHMSGNICNKEPKCVHFKNETRDQYLDQSGVSIRYGHETKDDFKKTAHKLDCFVHHFLLVHPFTQNEYNPTN